nr:RNA polymerase subunit sigma-70 [Actinomycetota bacterium]
TELLREDASWSMPPYELWLRGHADIRTWMLGPGIACKGSRLIATEANGSPAFAHYKPAEGGGHEAWALQILEIDGSKIAGVCFFLDAGRFFPEFGLPLRLDD